MSNANENFDAFIKEEMKHIDGVAVTIKASLPEIMLKKKVPIAKLHPNPADEFCWPNIGPNYGIISKYEANYRRFGNMKKPGELGEDPIMVEKIYPDGYMILNGHHRWAAYRRLGVKRIRVSIVNLTQETDIKKMLSMSEHDKRVTMDLDEVIFCEGDMDDAEKPLPFPRNKMYKERLRKGIPSLMHFLSKNGYDIWVYTSKYYTHEYIQAYLKRYSVKVNGIITGTARKLKEKEAAKKQTENLFKEHYKETLHIDRGTVLHINNTDGEFDDYEINASGEEWSKAVIDIIRRLEKDGKK